ncbi:4-hydroxy-tetrahydrodipicolinate reductase [Kribbella sp. NPDC049227]|uniref:4-hydroxy-tetrahydrodipicolinate reductase n=1 Tax=Kribbella sp. NPDC049227 TaxID=3364113 RepID=UPI003718C222
MIRVGIVGAAGKMGRALCIAALDDPDIELVAAIGRSKTGMRVAELVGRPDTDVRLSDRLETLLDANVDVALEFTSPDSVMGNARWFLDHGVHSAIGTTGIGAEDLAELRSRAEAGPANMFVGDAFSVTDAVGRHIAKIAARYIPNVELSETHPPTKADAPSGTCVRTAQELARVGASSPKAASREIIPGARGGEIDGIRVHSLRQWGGPGFEEIRFSLPGETMTIVLTPWSREPYANGALRVAKAVVNRRGFTYGFESLLGLD